ncbi:response regulator transcription factor [Pseudomonas sp. zfem005]|uniref:response regulator n=1 Tax=Pseudomonas sp. zfem005 TaxID=3078200 RepID=UPI0029294A80|nr:response regulator transcription factor [Pseudomonas sp. zfem005]MDU9414392.1 response regulator transcription factor [Pseudomonas sp. zfem005]
MQDEPIHTLLIVDVQPIVRLAIREVLRDKGFNIIGESTRGDIALRLVRTLVPDLVILDLDLPDMDGLSVLAAIREMPFEVPVVVFSALPADRFAHPCKQLGAAAYVSKKASAEQLVAALVSVTAQSDYLSSIPPD